MKLTIERSKWFRGHGPDHSKLLRADGKMCCLGFYCLALGMTQTHILDVADPNDAMKNLRLWPRGAWLITKEDGDFRTNSSDCHDLMHMNDKFDINQADREIEITKMFAKHKVQVEFVD